MGKKKGGGVRIKQVGPNKAAKAMMNSNPMEDLMIPPDEMVHLPPPPDRNYQIFWPISETFTMDPSDFMVIYPSYLDSTKSLKKGRRIGKDLAIATPTVSDISEALQSLGLRHVLQPHKGYSRDMATLWDNPGRVKVERTRVSIMDDENDISRKRKLLIEIAARIPSLPSRVQRLEDAAKTAAEAETKRKEEAAKKQPQQKQIQQQKQQQSQSSSTKKKGKKKR